MCVRVLLLKRDVCGGACGRVGRRRRQRRTLLLHRNGWHEGWRNSWNPRDTVLWSRCTASSSYPSLACKYVCVYEYGSLFLPLYTPHPHANVDAIWKSTPLRALRQQYMCGNLIRVHWSINRRELTQYYVYTTYEYIGFCTWTRIYINLYTYARLDPTDVLGRKNNCEFPAYTRYLLTYTVEEVIYHDYKLVHVFLHPRQI